MKQMKPIPKDLMKILCENVVDQPKHLLYLRLNTESTDNSKPLFVELTDKKTKEVITFHPTNPLKINNSSDVIDGRELFFVLSSR
jgi:hypothetical protein